MELEQRVCSKTPEPVEASHPALNCSPGLPGVVIGVTCTEPASKPGDIVQLKNSDTAFLVYLGKDSDGNVVLDDLYNKYSCSPQSFNLLFTGNAIFLNHTSTKVTRIDGSTVDDTPIHDPNTTIGPMHSGKSNYEEMISYLDSEENTNLPNLEMSSTPCIDKAVTSIKAKLPKNPNRDTIGRAIFAYVRSHVVYPGKKCISIQGMVIGTLKGGVGNCCDRARVNVELCRKLGVPA